MRSRKKLLMSCLLIVLMLMPTYAQESGSRPTSEKGSQNVYSEEEVNQIVDDLAAEAEASIDEAYAEGYKAGVKDYAPQVEFWKTKAEAKEPQEKAPLGKFFAAGVGTGIIISLLGCIAYKGVRAWKHSS